MNNQNVKKNYPWEEIGQKTIDEILKESAFYDDLNLIFKLVLGDNLATVRNERNVSANSLSNMINVSDAFVYKTESAKTEPCFSAVIRICAHLGVSIDDILPTAEQIRLKAKRMGFV